MKKQICFNNVIFPIWLLWLIPVTWIVILPANFIIDLAVIVLTLKYLKEEDIKNKAKSVIFKTWMLGFTADFIGTAIMFLSNIIDFDMNTSFGKWWYHNITNAVAYSPFDNLYSFLWVSISVAAAGFLIYVFNFKIAFKKLDIEIEKKRKLALSMAIFTAPYLFYIPTAWFY